MASVKIPAERVEAVKLAIGDCMDYLAAIKSDAGEGVVVACNMIGNLYANVPAEQRDEMARDISDTLHRVLEAHIARPEGNVQ